MSTKMGIYGTFNTTATMQPIKRVDMVVNVGSKFAINSNCLKGGDLGHREERKETCFSK